MQVSEVAGATGHSCLHISFGGVFYYPRQPESCAVAAHRVLFCVSVPDVRVTIVNDIELITQTVSETYCPVNRGAGSILPIGSRGMYE